MADPNSRPTLAQRKSVLIAEAHQARLRLQEASAIWYIRTAPVDRVWATLREHRVAVIAGVGVLAIVTLRRPAQLLRWGVRAVLGWQTWQALRGSGGASGASWQSRLMPVLAQFALRRLR